MVLPHQSLEYLKDRDDESGRIRGEGGAQSHRHRRRLSPISLNRIATRPASNQSRAASDRSDRAIAKGKRHRCRILASRDIQGCGLHRSTRRFNERRLALGNLFGFSPTNRFLRISRSRISPYSRVSSLAGSVTSGSRNSVPATPLPPPPASFRFWKRTESPGTRDFSNQTTRRFAPFAQAAP